MSVDSDGWHTGEQVAERYMSQYGEQGNGYHLPHLSMHPYMHGFFLF